MVNEPGELGSVQEKDQEKELLEQKLGEGSVVPCDVRVRLCVSAYVCVLRVTTMRRHNQILKT